MLVHILPPGGVEKELMHFTIDVGNQVHITEVIGMVPIQIRRDPCTNSQGAIQQSVLATSIDYTGFIGILKEGPTCTQFL